MPHPGRPRSSTRTTGASSEPSGSTASISVPALQGGAGYYLDGGKLAAFDIAAGKTLWSAGDGSFALGPLVVNGAVYVLSRSGTLYAIDRRTGRTLWQAEGGPNAALIDRGRPVTGMAAGDGLLVVPAGRILAAFGAGPDK